MGDRREGGEGGRGGREGGREEKYRGQTGIGDIFAVGHVKNGDFGRPLHLVWNF